MLFQRPGKDGGSGRRSNVEQRGRGQEVPRAHPGDTRGVDPLWSQPTSLVATRQDRKTTLIMAEGEGGTKRNLVPPSNSPAFHLKAAFRPPDLPQPGHWFSFCKEEATAGRYPPSRGPPGECPFRCTSGRCFPCRLATANARRVSSSPSL